MDKEKIKDYTLRVSQASRTELVVIMYDIILSDIEDAKGQSEAGRTEDFRRSIKHALRFVNELMSILDFTYDIAKSLMSLYMYVQRILVECDVCGTGEKLTEVLLVINGLRSAFARVSSEDVSGPVMANTQQIYAGLTYGRGSLNEADLDPNQVSRGFLA